MKKALSIILAVAMLVSMSFTTLNAADNTNKSTNISIGEFEIFGVEYYKGMEVIDKKSQLEYSLKVDKIVFDGNSINLKGNILCNKTEMGVVDDVGVIYKSTAKKLVKVNGITAIFSPKNELEIVSCVFEQNADLGELLPVNSGLEGKTVLKVAISIAGNVYYFEGEFPARNKYNDIFNLALDSSDSKGIMSEMKNVSADKDISEKEVVQLAEHWKHSLFAHGEKIEMLDDKYESNTRATTPVIGIPVTRFTTEGAWLNQYGTYMGYYIITYPVGGTNNFVSYVIKWEYLQNSCGNFVVNQTSPNKGTVGIKINNAQEFTYYAVRDSIECTDTFIPYRIKNASVSMGLCSNTEILTGVTRQMQANGSSISVNWVSILGLLPVGTVYSTAISLFGAIQYCNEAVSSPTDSFQNTKAGQMQVYGKLVRGYRLTDNGKYLAKSNDKLQFDFDVVRPSDIPPVTGTKYIANAYYFEIYERDAYTLKYDNLIGTINETRSSSYSVK